MKPIPIFEEEYLALEAEATWPDLFFPARGLLAAEDLAECLAEADRVFREDKDVVAALMGTRIALAHGAPVPPSIAGWLESGVAMLLNGERKSIDEALGLKKKGRANPLRAAKEAAKLRAALNRMLVLQRVGASIPEAATLVASLSPDFKQSTLIDRYRRSGYTEEAADADRRVRDWLARQGNRLSGLSFATSDPENTLAGYPDRPLAVKQAKAAIRAKYAKRRT
jgi:hypothetical protein